MVKKGDDRQRRAQGKRMNWGESKYLWVMNVSEVCRQSSQFESDVSISEFKKLWNRKYSFGGWVEEGIERWSRGGKSQEKYMNEEERKISRLLNYRDIIKSISLFTTPTTVFRYYPGMDDSLRLSHDLLSDFHDFSDSSIVNFDHQISSQI